MNILFWLYKSRVNKKGLSPVMMRVTLEGQRLNLITQVDIEETSWDKDRQRIKGNGDLVKAYNNRLLQLKTIAWDYYNECTFTKTATGRRHKEPNSRQRRNSTYPVRSDRLSNQQPQGQD